MSASPPTTTSTMWHPRCTLSSTRAAMLLYELGIRDDLQSTPVLRAASRWASTRASPVSMRTLLAGRGPSWGKLSIPGAGVLSPAAGRRERRAVYRAVNKGSAQPHPHRGRRADPTASTSWYGMRSKSSSSAARWKQKMCRLSGRSFIRNIWASRCRMTGMAV